MNKMYAGLVSNPINKIDTQSKETVTYTFGGAVEVSSSADPIKPDDGVIPPARELVASVWANQACTEKPNFTDPYQILYVKLEKELKEDDSYVWRDADNFWFELFGYLMGTNEPGCIRFNIDWVFKGDGLTNIEPGIYALESFYPYEIPVGAPFNFYSNETFD